MKNHVMKMRVLYIFAALFLFVCALCIKFFADLQPVVADADSAGSYQLEVVSGETLYGIAKKLGTSHFIRSERAFLIYARIKNYTAKRGLYQISAAMTAQQILHIIDAGVSVPVIVSIPEGYTVKKIARLLDEKKICAYEDFLAAANDSEGFLFPDTYFLSYALDAQKVVQTMTSTFYDKIASIDGLKDLSAEALREKVTLASIVEREYRLASEAPLIAGVFVNRLEHNIALQSCATVEYIITEIEDLPHPEIITYKDLEKKNPYNTYIYPGLTPTPICNPGLTALNAAANPTKSDYYFFRLIDAKKGEHYFSKDFSEHNEIGRVYYTKSAS